MVTTRNGSCGSRLLKELHPMKNEILLALVFDSCDVETLKNCRLVCTQWRNVSVNAWRRKAVLSLTNRKKRYAEPTTLALLELKKFVKGDDAIRDNLDLPNDIVKKPFENYKFYEFNYNYWLNYRFFLVSFRHNIKFLEIPFDMERCPSNVLVNKIILELPNLQELRLEFVYSCVVLGYLGHLRNVINPSAPLHRSLRGLQVFGQGMEGFKWREFLRIMPNLETLKIGEVRPSSEMVYVLGSIMEAISSIRKGESKILNLAELEIQPYLRNVPDHVMTSILDCRLPLKRLSINLAAAEVFRVLLESHAKTLEVVTAFILNVGDSDDFIYSASNTPMPMENLTELDITSGLICGFSFVASLLAPKMEKLILKEARVEVAALFLTYREMQEWKWEVRKEENQIMFKTSHGHLLESPPMIMSQLHTFECDHDWTNFTPEKIGIFAKAMPNLKHLSLPLTSKSFREVCASWPKLWTLKTVELDLEAIGGKDVQIGDEAITGIQFGGKEPEPSVPNISDLKELTDFWIKSCSPWNAILTDQSVIHGFLKLNRLHSLRIAFIKLSRKTRDLLEARVPFCEITVKPRNKKIM